MTDNRLNLFLTGMALLCAACVVSACAGDTDAALGTTVRLDVRYEDSWSLGELGVAARDLDERVEVSHELLLTLPDGWAGEPLDLVIDGFRGNERYAHGEVTFTPELGAEVSATITLTRLPCGAWCTEGAMQCEGDGVVVCEQRDDDACMEWSAVVPCSADAPFCSLGTCLADCVDECAEGETTCNGPGGVRVCGENDSDSCLDWLTVVACSEGETCSAGSCGTVCRDECTDGALRCSGAGNSLCGDLNLDGCTEWGPAAPCPSGESCSSDVCAPVESCTDECSTNICVGESYTRCGNYDLDACLEPSPGTSCVPADTCLEGRCTPTGCETIPRTCAEPPASECADASTLRVYDATGVCGGGDCSYAYTDTNCPDGCTGGACMTAACAGVTCDAPPADTCADASTLRTYSAPGTCTGGTCSYAPADMACAGGCSAGACTTDPCAGVICDAPPADSCVDGSTLRTYSAPGTCSEGACSYVPSDVTCADGCSAARCTTPCTPGPWVTQVVDSGGRVGGNTSLAVDAAGAIHISYDEEDTGDLRYARRSTAGTWTTGSVDLGAGFGSQSSIAADAAGGVHIALYYDGSLGYAHRPPTGTWDRRTVDAGDYMGYSSSVTVDTSGGVHISYLDRLNWNLKYAYRSSAGAWSAITVSTAGDAGEHSSVATDMAGGVHVAYDDRSNQNLNYAYRSPAGSWTTTIVDSVGDVGEYPSLAVDGSGGVHVSYYDATSEGLKYAYRSPAGAWSTRAVDAGRRVGLYTSLAVDVLGGVHVTHGNGALNYAYRSAGGMWSTAVVDSDGNVGDDNSLAIDGSGGLHISYYDRTNYDLKYAYRCP